MMLFGISIVSLEEPAVQWLHLQKKRVSSSHSDLSLFPSLIMMLPCFWTSFSQSYVLLQFLQLQVFHQSHSFLLFLCVSCPQLPKSILCSLLSLPSCFPFSLCSSLWAPLRGQPTGILVFLLYFPSQNPYFVSFHSFQISAKVTKFLLASWFSGFYPIFVSPGDWT